MDHSDNSVYNYTSSLLFDNAEVPQTNHKLFNIVKGQSSYALLFRFMKYVYTPSISDVKHWKGDDI